MLQFTKLRLAGFKSFVDPAELLIEPGLTGIVGPNGCGKSNLIEALRWVMGETSAKQMRGGEMDDVIFAGSAERPGRDIAEVVLELDNGARTAPPPYADADELLVSRRIERSKGSVYRLNGREIRARDVHLLFADVASGARSAAMVTQGQVSQLVSAKPPERRALLEEAAGIVGLHARRHEAELRLQDAEANLRRLEDVLATLETQRCQLQEQAKRASRYRELSAAIRRLEATLLRLRWQAAEAAVVNARERFAVAGRTVATATGAAAAAAVLRLEAADALPALRAAEAAEAAALQQLMRDRDLLEAEERQVARDVEAARARSRQIEGDLRRERALADDAGAALDRLSAERQRLITLREGEADLLDEARRAAAVATAAVEELDARAQALTERVAADRARRSALVRARDEASAQAGRLAARRGELARQRHTVCDELSRLADPEVAATVADTAEHAVALAREAGERAEVARSSAASAEAATAAELRRVEAASARLEAEARTLAEIVGAGPGGAGSASGMFDRMRVAPGLEAAVAAALGDDLLAGENPADAAYWRSLPDYPDAPALPEGARTLTPADAAPPALARRLAQTGLIDGDGDARRLQAALRPGQRLVTRDGALWRWDGYTRAAGAPTPAAIRLRHKARLEALHIERAEADAVRAEAADRHADATEAARDAAAAEQRTRAEMRAAEGALARARQSLADAIAGRARLEQRLAGLDDAIASLEPEHEEAEGRKAALQEELDALGDDRREQTELDTVRAELGRRRAALVERQTRCDGLTRDSSGRARRLQSLEGEIASWTGRRTAALQQVAAFAERQSSASDEVARLEALPAEMALRRGRLFDDLAQAEAKRRDAGDRLAAADAALAEAERSMRTADAASAAAREEQVRAEAALEQADQALLDAVASIGDRLGVQPEGLAELAGEPLAGERDVVAGERRLDRMRRDRELIGPVNLRADTEKAELDERVAELQRQSADLVEAIAKLRRGMAELDREGRERLRAAFTEIDRHFQALFRRLFGGGQAHLTLTDADDPLVSGLEIMASPPGKKLQLMSLLSGGEQTLTALALRFAMFLQRPAPVCVLDEVDAALDDANVDRFCDLLGDLARGGTRFLVITHHRLTMARMDRLFGVTMAERGASRLVSVDLRGAEVLRQSA